MANSYWSTVEDFIMKLNKTKVAGSDPRIVAEDMFPHGRTPLPSDITDIPMHGYVDSSRFKENVTKNILEQALSLKLSTWMTFKYIFDLVDDNDDDPIRQHALEMLYVITKLCAREYHKWYFPDCREKYPDHYPTNMSISEFFEKRHLLQDTLPVVIDAAKNHLGLFGKNAVPELIATIKQFLLNRPIVNVFMNGLEKLKIPEHRRTEQFIKNAISDMEIEFVPVSPFGLNGLALRHGIWLKTTFNVVKRLSDLNDLLSAKTNARLLCLACRETGHFLARLADGNYTFASPSKFEFEENEEDDEDEKEESEKKEKEEDTEKREKKKFEFGRFIEIKLCGIQVSWLNSSAEAAYDFITSASKVDTYPSVKKNPNLVNYLAKRQIPSLSFSGDLVFEFDELFDEW